MPNLKYPQKAPREGILWNTMKWHTMLKLCSLPHHLWKFWYGDARHWAWGEWVHHKCHAVVQFSWHTMPHTLSHTTGSAQLAKSGCCNSEHLHFHRSVCPTVIIPIPCKHTMHACSLIKGMLGPWTIGLVPRLYIHLWMAGKITERSWWFCC